MSGIHERLSSPGFSTLSSSLRSSRASVASSRVSTSAADAVRSRREAAEEALMSLSSPRSLAGTLGGGASLVLPAGDDGDGDGVDTLDTGLHLQLLFQYYCRFGRGSSGGALAGELPAGGAEEPDTLTNVGFAKFCRECPHLLDKRLTLVEADLVFVKAKPKFERRLNYAQWLDALSALASAKYPELESDAAGAFALLLTQHVLVSPHATGIAQALRAGLISVSSASMSPSAARGGGGGSVVSSSSSSGRNRSSSPSRLPLSIQALTASSSSSSSSSVLEGVVSSRATAAAAAQGGDGAKGEGAAGPFLAAAAAQMAAFAEQALHAADAVAAAVAAGGGGASAAATQGQQQQVPAASPGAMYEVLARKAREIQAAAAAAAEALSLSIATASGRGGAGDVDPMARGRSSSRGGGVSAAWSSVGPHSLHAAPDVRSRTRSPSSSGNQNSSSAASSVASSSALHSSITGAPPVSLSSFRGVVSEGRLVLSAQSLGAGGSGASRPRAPSPRRYDALGSPAFKPLLAGEANAPGSVWERMADPASFTGVYRRAWESDGRINQYAEADLGCSRSRFVGNTNTNSDEHISSIRGLLRPNLNRAAPPHRPNFK